MSGSRRLVVAAGLSAAAGARRMDADLDILVFERTGFCSYSAADQRPRLLVRWAGVEEVDGRVELQAGAAAGEQVPVGRRLRRQLAEVDGDELQFDRGQVLVVVDHPA